ncbi:hypothetical protein ADK75_30140 [Streptomyces virginiae]|uniref:Uncharacterized protein n=1 Tax=Streptomyces virginiae TaxID=1961 RepID=A0A0L8M5Y2_STRVG|nr:hypothetical protein [Streptomyces virginiae]KOG45719.1 hypothetical protein ADK75_30140 [Streptomyces virginiae]
MPGQRGHTDRSNGQKAPAGPALLGTSRALDIFVPKTDGQNGNTIYTSHYLASQNIWTGGRTLNIVPMREAAVADQNGQAYVMYNNRG